MGPVQVQEQQFVWEGRVILVWLSLSEITPDRREWGKGYAGVWLQEFKSLLYHLAQGIHEQVSLVSESHFPPL